MILPVWQPYQWLAGSLRDTPRDQEVVGNLVTLNWQVNTERHWIGDLVTALAAVVSAQVAKPAK